MKRSLLVFTFIASTFLGCTSKKSLVNVSQTPTDTEAAALVSDSVTILESVEDFCATTSFIYQHLGGDLDHLKVDFDPNAAGDGTALYFPIDSAKYAFSNFNVVGYTDQFGQAYFCSAEHDYPILQARYMASALTNCLHKSGEYQVEDGLYSWNWKEGNKRIRLYTSVESNEYFLVFFTE